MLNRTKQFFAVFTLLLCISGAANAFTSVHGDVWSQDARFDQYFLNRIEVQSSDLKSRSEVVREVKSRYNAKVLRVEFKKDRQIYKVRVLMPNGKVRDLTISARR